MPTEDTATSLAYFDTPERNERLQLITHLLNNAEDVPYLRAPEGAGKTRFAAHLVEKVEGDYLVVWLNGGTVSDLVGALAAELGLDTAELSWPGDLLAAAGERLLLVVIDDADTLDLSAIGQLFDLHDAGARLLFLGTGGLSQLQGDWDLQFVDLPPFSEQQSRTFLENSAHMPVGTLSAEFASGLHRAAGGLPGHLVNALGAVPANPSVDSGVAAGTGGLSLPMLLLGGAAILLLILVLVFQDGINSLFESAGEPAEVVARPESAQDAKMEAIERPAQPAPLPKRIPEPELPVVQVPVEHVDVQSDEKQKTAETPPETGPVAADQPDPVLDAVIDAAIAAAEQPVAAGQQPPQVEAVASETGAQAQQVAQQADSKTPQPDAVAAEPAVEPKPVAREAAAPKAASDDTTWLKAQQPEKYTLQLVGARDRASIDKFVERNRVAGPYAVYVRDLNGKPWYSLVAGVYASRDAAVEARSRLPAPLNGSGVWPRTFASIHEQLGH